MRCGNEKKKRPTSGTIRHQSIKEREGDPGEYKRVLLFAPSLAIKALWRSCAAELFAHFHMNANGLKGSIASELELLERFPSNGALPASGGWSLFTSEWRNIFTCQWRCFCPPPDTRSTWSGQTQVRITCRSKRTGVLTGVFLHDQPESLHKNKVQTDSVSIKPPSTAPRVWEHVGSQPNEREERPLMWTSPSVHFWEISHYPLPILNLQAGCGDVSYWIFKRYSRSKLQGCELKKNSPQWFLCAWRCKPAKKGFQAKHSGKITPLSRAIVWPIFPQRLIRVKQSKRP